MSDATATLRIKTVMDSSDAISNIGQLQKRLESLKLPKNLTEKAQAGFDELKKTAREYQELVDKPKKSNADLNRIDQLGSQMKKQFADVEKYIRNIDFSKIDYSELDSPKLDEVRNKIEEIINSCKRLAKDAFQGAGLTDDLNKPIGKLKELQNIADKMTARKGKRLFEGLIGDIETGDIDAVVAKVKEIKTYMNQQKGASKQFKEYAEAKPIIEALLNTFREMKPSLDEINSYAGQAAKEVDHLGEEFNEVGRAELDRVGAEMREIGDYTNQAAHATNTWANSLGTAAHKQTEMQQQVQNLQQQIKNYFGLDEVFRKIGDLAREAMDTVKELDAAMTETAVVTNFSVSDMWDMLPTYTKNANALGSTIADVYNAATLYYQQGLTTSQSMALANETLKMARIGGIEAAEATDMMTAALRGFNMEINQTSAQKINDVYSKLAAITAADTKEIGSAMERTASIASSANMDFETTSAFLSQMIETTREAPENLGTAMKTIIARFQELKVDPNSLVDSEGEALDFNRVDKALKSIGVSLVDTQGQFRDLDDVFLEISSRWDGLSQAQQRYIATMAAGSRQQSRFIAMMQDYDRTMELVDAAYASEGAGQAQFEKTLESMDSKLNRLKNAWDQFVMGLMNADFLKKGVDIATGFLSVFEKIIDTVSKVGVIDPFQGIIKSALTATAVFGGLLGMSKLLMVGVGKFASFVMDDNVENMTGWAGNAARVYGKKKPPVDKEKKAEIINAGKEEAKLRQAAYESAFKEQDRGKGVSSYFGQLKAGGQAETQMKNFQKQLHKMMGKGAVSTIDFKTAFKGMGKDAQNTLGPQIKSAFEEAVKTSNLDETGKLAAQAVIDGANAEFLKGNIDAGQMFDQMQTGIAQKGYDVDIDADKLAKEVAPVGAQFEKIGSGAERAGQAVQTFGANLMGTPLQPFGMALMTVGQVTENVGMLMGSGVAAIKAWGHSMVEAGAETALAGAEAGVATKFFAGLGKTIWGTLKPLLPFIAGVAAAAIIIGGIAYAATASERAFERQGDAAAQASQDLDTCKQALEAVNNDLEELSNNDNALDSLVKGTTEWNNQLAEANSHIIEMMKHYQTLNEIGSDGEYKYINIDKDGRMSITKAGQEAIKKEYTDAVNLAAANDAVQGALYNNLKDLRSEEWKTNSSRVKIGEQIGAPAQQSDDYKQARLQNKNIKDMNEAREENAWKTGIHQVLNESRASNREAVETLLTNQRDTLLEANKVAQFSNQAEIEKEYAKLRNFERTGEETYVDAQGNQLTIGYDEVKEMLPELRSLAQMRDSAEDVSKALTKMDTSFSSSGLIDTKNDTLLSDIVAKSMEASADDISNLLEKNDKGVSKLDEFIQSKKLDKPEEFREEEARELEKLVGAEEGSIKTMYDFNNALTTYSNLVKENGQTIIEAQKDYQTATVGLLKNAGFEDSYIKQLTDPGQKGGFSYEEMSKMATIADNMSDNLGSDAAEHFITGMANGLDQGKIGSEARKLILDELSGVDFSNALQVVDSMNNLSKTIGVAGAKGAREYSKNFKKTFDYDQQVSSALQQVLTSDDLAEATKDVDGAFTAAKITEVAESSQSLKTYLDATNMSAGTFADIMNQLNEAELDLTDLTPGLVAFANAMDQVSNATGKALYSIQSFEAGDDLGAVDDFVKDAKSSLDEMAKQGEWGNDQMGAYFDHLITNEGKTWEETATNLGSYKKAYDVFNKKLDKILIGGDGDNAGEFDVKALSKGLDFSKGTEKALKKLKHDFNLTDEGANEALTAIVNRSSKAKLQLQKGDAKNAYQDLRETNAKLGDKYGTESIGSLDEILKIPKLLEDDKEAAKQFWKQLESDYGKETVGKIKDLYENGNLDFQELHKQASELVANEKLITTNAGSTDTEIANEVARVFNDKNVEKLKEGDALQKTGKNGPYDLEKATEAFTLAAGGDQNRGYEALEAYIKNNNLEGKEFELYGQTVKGSEILETGISDLIDKLSGQEQWVTVGETIGQAIVEYLKDPNKEKREEVKETNQRKQHEQTEARKVQESKRNIDSIAQRTEGVKNYYDKSAITDKNKLDTDSFGKLVGNVIKNVNGKKQQSDITGQYLQNQGQKLLKQGASNEQIKKSMQDAAKEMHKQGMGNKQIVDALNKGYGTNLTKEGIKFKKDGSVKLGLGEEVEQLQNKLKHLEGDLTLKIVGITGLATGQNNPNSAFSHYGTMARGSRSGYTIPGRPTLTGEEGEELVWEPKQNKAYMVGSNGPQFADISRDAVVWNAAQTKRIKKNSGSVGRFGTSSKGIRNFGTMDGGTLIGASARKMAGKGSSGSSMTSLGQFTIDAIANITDVKEPKPPKTIPVYADVKIKNEKGGLWGEKDKTKTIPVTAQITKTVNKTKKSVKGIKATATVTKVKKAGTVKGEPVKVKASATVNTVAKTDSASGAISNLASAANSTQTMTVNANTGAAEAKVNALISKFNKTYTLKYNASGPTNVPVQIRPDYGDDSLWKKTVTVKVDKSGKPAAEGMNYKKYNSYASGTPRAKGGLTLTGEEGYEVVWMPRQKQSMIVGTKGPQMLELPSDAVVWPHDQSKKILKNNKGVPAQSYAKGSSKKKYKPKAADKYGVYKTVPSEQKFFKWIAAVEKSEKNIEKWGKSLDKASEAMDRYAKYVGGNSKALFNSKVTEQFNLLSKQLKAANSELTNAKKLTSAINNSRKKESISVTKHSGPDAGSRNVRYSQGKLVNRNKKTGELSINESYIRSVAGSRYKKGKKKGKRKYNTYEANQIMTEMRSAAQSLVDEYNGHLESAKDLQDEVKQKQQELRDSIKETFYEFEHDLDRIKELQSNISLFDSFESRVSAIQSYLDSKMKAGFATSKQTIGQYTKFLEQQADNLLNKITAQRDLTNLATATLSNDTKTYDEYKAWKNAQSATAKAKKHGVNSSQYQKALAEEEYRKQEYDRVVLGSKYVKVGKDSKTGQITVTLNEGKLADANLKSEDYQAVKDYYENILQKVQDINQGVADVHSGIASAYDQITSAYTDVDNFAKNVINGMQESEQETIDSLKTLNESLRDAFSDLIDNVRKELDKQRKAEQNQKTEKDITDKMNRLAMLRADTSGSNAAEIAQLEKEITESTGDYEDSLEDQLLDKLQDDADKAAEQRERQISVLEEQLEYTKAIGQYVTRAENLVQKYINGTATAAEEAELRSYYMLGANGKEPMTKWAKWLAEGEFESAATKVKTFNSTIEKLTNTIKSLEEVLANLKTNPAIGDTNAQQAEQLAGQMKEAGKSAQEVYSKLKEKGLNDSQIAKELRKAGYTGAQAAAIKDLSAKELKAGGYSAKDLASSKSAETLLKAGYTYKEIAPYYSEKTLQKAAADTGTTNKAKDFGGGKTKLSGTTKTVTNYKNKKGKAVNIKDTTGTFTEGGSVAFAKGSQVWYKNSKTGKITKKYPLNKFTKAQISPKNAEYKEFAQAIKFAMTNNKVGSKVPGLVTALKTAISTGAWKKAGYNKGWDLKGAKVKGSAGSNGLIYYNSGDAVKTWNPSSGNINTIKYNKADFAKKAALTYVGREYANAREYHKKKYKKYLTGGLANYTGPAWMDGTPSKPELVLNATDTKNFMALKDVLSEATKRGAFNRKEENISQGDMTFDININVDKIDSDYDVDKVAKRVEKIITTKAKTRNVTVVGRSR